MKTDGLLKHKILTSRLWEERIKAREKQSTIIKKRTSIEQHYSDQLAEDNNKIKQVQWQDQIKNMEFEIALINTRSK